MAALAERLRVVGMPSQSVIARETGVSQSTVSRAAHGLIKTRSEGACRLWAYTSGRVEVIGGAGPKELATGATRAPGTPRRRPRRRASARNAAAPDLSAMSKVELVELAVAGLKDYLADAFDPRLVIEQISVLRRAQDRRAR